MPGKIIPRAALALLLACIGGPALAHHSFAVFFDPSKTITIKGQVREFRFTNPHGLIVLDVPQEGGRAEGVPGGDQCAGHPPAPRLVA